VPDLAVSLGSEKMAPMSPAPDPESVGLRQEAEERIFRSTAELRALIARIAGGEYGVLEGRIDDLVSRIEARIDDLIRRIGRDRQIILNLERAENPTFPLRPAAK
jgi:hypothetical protein